MAVTRDKYWSAVKFTPANLQTRSSVDSSVSETATFVPHADSSRLLIRVGTGESEVRNHVVISSPFSRNWYTHLASGDSVVLDLR